MSHASAQVRFPDGTILHAEYNGTADVIRATLFDTREEMRTYWRQLQPGRPAHPRDVETAEAATDYGGGFSWLVQASKVDRVVVGGVAPFDDYKVSMRDGLPSWWA